MIVIAISCGEALQSRPAAGRAVQTGRRIGLPSARKGLGLTTQRFALGGFPGGVSKLRDRKLSAPEFRQIIAPGEAPFASPGLAGKLGMSPEAEGAIE